MEERNDFVIYTNNYWRLKGLVYESELRIPNMREIMHLAKPLSVIDSKSTNIFIYY